MPKNIRFDASEADKRAEFTFLGGACCLSASRCVRGKLKEAGVRHKTDLLIRVQRLSKMSRLKPEHLSVSRGENEDANCTVAALFITRRGLEMSQWDSAGP